MLFLMLVSGKWPTMFLSVSDSPGFWGMGLTFMFSSCMTMLFSVSFKIIITRSHFMTCSQPAIYFLLTLIFNAYDCVCGP